MYLSITNVGHKNTKYFITDISEELNIPNIPSGCAIVFQEKYTNNIKVLNDDEFKKIFSNNTLLYEIFEFNSSFKISEEDAIKYIDDEFNKLTDKFFKITSSFKLNIKNLDIINFIEKSQDIYNKNEIDDFITMIQNKINEINEKINFLNSNLLICNKNEIKNLFSCINNDLNLCKEKTKLMIS